MQGSIAGFSGSLCSCPSAAHKAFGLIGIAAGIGGDFRIGANRHLFVWEGLALGNHAFGRLVFAMPVFQKCERVYIIEGLAAAAVVHAGYHKQAAEALGVWRVGIHLAKPCHLVFGGKHGVGHAGEHNQFAAACAEGGQIGGHCIVNRAGLVGFGRVAVEIKFVQIKVRHGGGHEIPSERASAKRYAARIGLGRLRAAEFPCAPVGLVQAGVVIPAAVNRVAA